MSWSSNSQLNTAAAAKPVKPRFAPHRSVRGPHTCQTTGVTLKTLGSLNRATQSLLDSESDTRRRAQNVFILAHRAGNLSSLDQLLQAEFADATTPTIERAIRDARRSLKKVRRSLRVRSQARVTSLPVTGGLVQVLDDVLAMHGISRTTVINARFRKMNGRWVLFAAVQGQPKEKDMLAWARESARPTYCEDFGVAASAEGLWVSHRTIRDSRIVYGARPFDGAKPESRLNSVEDFRTNDAKNEPKRCRIAWEDMMNSEFCGEFWDAIQLKRKPRSVSIDPSTPTTLSPEQEQAFRRFIRGSRKRAAEDAIAFREVSHIGRESQKCRDYWAATGALTAATLRGIMSQALVECPHCGAPTSLKADPSTGAPTRSQERCGLCRRSVDVAMLLADRARTRGVHGWEQNSVPARVTVPSPDVRKDAKRTTDVAHAVKKGRKAGTDFVTRSEVKRPGSSKATPSAMDLATSTFCLHTWATRVSQPATISASLLGDVSNRGIAAFTTSAVAARLCRQPLPKHTRDGLVRRTARPGGLGR